jgi:hypothetical protein
MSDLTTGLAETSNSPQVDTVDAALDAAFASPPEESAASDTPAEPAPTPEPAAAIAQPPTQTEPEGAKGEPPKERWDTILSNARAKAREEALGEHKDALEIVQRLRTDFAGTLTQLLDEGVADPRFADAITSRAAAILSARRKAGAEDTEPQPDAVMRYEDGTTEPSYTPAQLRKWQEWRERQLERKVSEKFQPLQQLQEQFQRHQLAKQEADKAAGVAEQRGAVWKTMPFFADHRPAILERQQAIYDELKSSPGFDPVNSPWDALQRAYAEVVTAQALPKLQTQNTQALVAEAARKRAGSVSDPAASAPAQPRKPRTVDEALDQVFSGLA